MSFAGSNLLYHQSYLHLWEDSKMFHLSSYFCQLYDIVCNLLVHICIYQCITSKLKIMIHLIIIVIRYPQFSMLIFKTTKSTYSMVNLQQRLPGSQNVSLQLRAAVGGGGTGPAKMVVLMRFNQEEWWLTGDLMGITHDVTIDGNDW